MDISAVVITHNESRDISECLESLSWCDEIIVVDGQSDDGTQQIASKIADKVLVEDETDKASGFDHTRMLGIEAASNEWIFWLDADERAPQGIEDDINNWINSGSYDIISFPRKHIIFGKVTRSCGYWPDYEKRLFRQGSIDFSEGVHQFVNIDEDATEFKLPAEDQYAITHYRYRTRKEFLEKSERYSTVKAKQTDYVLGQWLWYPLKTFLARFLYHSGYKEGMHGLELSLLQAHYEFRLAEKSRKEK
jgi:glycosyltransferase involved in cell wall biosynthesis